MTRSPDHQMTKFTNSVRATVRGERDRLDIARHDVFQTDLDFHPEADINAPLLEERAPERTARQPRAGELWKKPPALHQHFTARRNDGNDPVQIILRSHGQLVELAQTIELQSV